MKLPPLPICVCLALLSVLVGALAGCGGSEGTETAATRVKVFLTDDVSTGYDQVWARIYSIELLAENGSTHQALESATGVEVDLRALDGRFKLLGAAEVPAGRYVGARITLGTQIALYPTGVTEAEAATLGTPQDGRTTVTANFAAPLEVSVLGGNLVLDAVLSEWQLEGGVLTPVFRLDDLEGFDDPANHEEEDFVGQVVGLTGSAPSQSFRLDLGDAESLLIQTDSATLFTSETGGPNPTLAEGDFISVALQQVPGQDALAARWIHIYNVAPPDDDTPALGGLASEPDVETRTFLVRLDEAEGFLPFANPVSVVATSEALFFDALGQPISDTDFFAILGSGNAYVVASGTYDETNRVFTATEARLAASDAAEVAVTGPVSEIDDARGSFKVTVTGWWGETVSASILDVVVAEDANFEGLDGEPIDRADFFFAIGQSGFAKAEGTLEGTTLTATELEVEAASD